VVAVTRDGSVFLGKNKTTASELAPKVKDMLANKPDKTVYIRSDARAKYKDVVEVVDNVRAAGVDNVGLLTEKIEDKAEAAQPKS
jgi:biopolymer transport protein ExbD